MSRRDTIIIALLINACLLALLFMLAINPDEDKVTDQPEINQAVSHHLQEVPKISSEPVVIANNNPSGDEVDNFLKNLTAEDSTQPLILDEEGFIELEKEPGSLASSAVREPGNSENVRYVEIVVKRGDALEKIARHNGTTVEAIKKVNNLSSAKLSIGQVLRIPIRTVNQGINASAVATEPKAISSTKPSAAATIAITSPMDTKAKEQKPKDILDIQYYTVKVGDNPWKIAKQFNVKFEDLLRMNNLDEEKARNLKIGDKLRVR